MDDRDHVFTVETTEQAMLAIAPDQYVESQVLSYFAPRLHVHGRPFEIDGVVRRVAIRAGNIKITESDDQQYGADGFIEVDGARIGVVDPERKTNWNGHGWPPRWTVNIAVHPMRQFNLGVFCKNSRTNKLRYMKQCAQRGYPGFIMLYSNAFGDMDKPMAKPVEKSAKAALLVPATALYDHNGHELLPVDSQPNSKGPDLPVFKVPFDKCVLVTQPVEFEKYIEEQVINTVRSLRHEG
jgi:hypothetical protein